MTIPTFPTLKGIAWPVKRSPIWENIKQKPVSGKETRLQLWTYPRYKFDLTFEILPGGQGSGFMANSDYQSLVGLYNSVAGTVLPFHFKDIWSPDNAAVGQALGTGDGATTQFNFVRPFGGFVEPIQDVTQSGVVIYNNGTPVSGSDYTFLTDSNWGFTYGIQFNSAPASGHAITADFNYNWPCRFDDDSIDFESFLFNFWALKKLSFTTVKVI